MDTTEDFAEQERYVEVDKRVREDAVQLAQAVVAGNGTSSKARDIAQRIVDADRDPLTAHRTRLGQVLVFSASCSDEPVDWGIRALADRGTQFFTDRCMRGREQYTIDGCHANVHIESTRWSFRCREGTVCL